MPELGLFPLSLVLVPTEQLPLHIFEPRYRELIAECLETGGEFGLVLATGDGAVHEVGTRARVMQVLETLEDGSSNIVIEGGDRFRLLELTSGRSFTTAEVEPVLDDDDPPDPADVARALQLFTQLADEVDAEIELPDEDAAQLDFELAALVDIGVDPKQELLASTSPRERMKRLAELLGIALEAVRLEKTVHARAGQNGKVAPLDPER
ncbi:MAG: LON peptidase substrate-binding domain-containing protein [Actinobacteria bacterium]|nr:LON peptidase substrate-binding domain-containing protein [Actinomycetota bacterium]